MGVMVVTREMLAAKFESILPHLDERQRRLLLGAAGQGTGHGGIPAGGPGPAGVREATGSLGVSELEAGGEPLGRVRLAGRGPQAGRRGGPGPGPGAAGPGEPQERGDPVLPLRWTAKSTRALAAALTAQGHKVSADTVGELLRAAGYSLQGNAKTLEGAQHPDRDAQFQHISGQVRAFQAPGTR